MIVDTNVTSELMRPAPSPSAVGSGRSCRPTSGTRGRSLSPRSGYGMEQLPGGWRKAVLKATAEDVFSAFSSQVLAFDAAADLEDRSIVRRCDRPGAPIEGFDAQIASICRAHDGSVATRYVEDFQHAGIDVNDPWGET